MGRRQRRNRQAAAAQRPAGLRAHWQRRRGGGPHQRERRLQHAGRLSVLHGANLPSHSGPRGEAHDRDGGVAAHRGRRVRRQQRRPQRHVRGRGRSTACTRQGGGSQSGGGAGLACADKSVHRTGSAASGGGGHTRAGQGRCCRPTSACGTRSGPRASCGRPKARRERDGRGAGSSVSERCRAALQARCSKPWTCEPRWRCATLRTGQSPLAWGSSWGVGRHSGNAALAVFDK